uniref:Uncharacterized protein n=1 Tax=Triticum urartu TaxID=4572 RepID=A0A8R7Q3E8_TRIUA
MRTCDGFLGRHVHIWFLGKSIQFVLNKWIVSLKRKAWIPWAQGAFCINIIFLMCFGCFMEIRSEDTNYTHTPRSFPLDYLSFPQCKMNGSNRRHGFRVVEELYASK